jgi:hypothetical protein
MWVAVFAVLLALSPDASAAAGYTCSATPSNACGQGTCPAGQGCGYHPTISHPGGYCGCSATTTTTLPGCALKSGKCSGACAAGKTCMSLPSASHPGNYCGCGTPSTTTTLKACSQNLKSGACEGACSKGYSCAPSAGGCACSLPTTSTLRHFDTVTTSSSTTTSSMYSTAVTYIPTTSTGFPFPDVAAGGVLPTTSTMMRFGYVAPDRDGDGVSDLHDNCVDVPNANQLDADGDRLGDVCDGCSVNPVCRASYCCAETSSYEACVEGSRRGDTGRMHYYWEDLYDLIDSRGCGCADTDGGVDPYNRGIVYSEDVETDIQHTPSGAPPGASAGACTSDSGCVRSRIDTCDIRDQSNRSLSEYYCNATGWAKQMVTCPYGCFADKCRCPDTDGGRYYYDFGEIEGTGYQDVCEYDNSREGWSLREVYCDFDEETGNSSVRRDWYECPLDCWGGECKCFDTDGGRDIFENGSVWRYHDHCVNGSDRLLVEYWVDFDRLHNACALRNETVTCEARCSGDRCLQPSCHDGIMNQGEEDIDCGGPCNRTCDMCALVRESDANIPSHFDWRSYRGRNYMSAVKDQGECGSCWIFSAVGVIEAKYNIESTPVGVPVNHSAELNLSEQYMVSNCYGSGSCGGGDTYLAYRHIQEHGIPVEGCFPYEARTTYCRPCDGWEDDAWTFDDLHRAKRRSDPYSVLKKNIICNGPVNTCGGGHCVVLVGWQEDREPSGWIFKNSWGEDWPSPDAMGYAVMSTDDAWMSMDTQKYMVGGVHML